MANNQSNTGAASSRAAIVRLRETHNAQSYDCGSVSGSDDAPKRKKRKPKNVFDDKTARWLLRLIKGKKEASNVVLPNAAPPKPVEPRDAQEELAEAIRDSLRPWFLSILFHAIILLILALCFLPRLESDNLTIIFGIGDELTEFPFDKNLGLHEERNDVIIVNSDKPEVDDPMAQAPEVDVADIGPEATVSETVSTLPPGLNPDGREWGRRADMLAKGGGNGKTDQAVIDGLRWLAKVQERNGSWRLSGPFPHRAAPEKDDPIAATAMALLAFQGFGVTPDSREPMLAEFALPVARGWDWLRRQQEPSGCFFRQSVAHTNHRFYTHALCTIAICELYAMTRDETLRKPALTAVAYCVKTQNLAGGWRYSLDQLSYDADVSVTGWVLLALKSAQGAGLEVPDATFEKISAFLDTTSRENGSQSVYQDVRGEVPRLSMSAEALLCRELLGWKRNDSRLERGIENLSSNHPITFTEPNKRDVYYWYYATQAIHHYGGEPWRRWNEQMREELPKHQEKRGDVAGSWHPQQPQSDEWWYYGRLYTTCLSIYMLEVYYRHLTIY